MDITEKWRYPRFFTDNIDLAANRAVLNESDSRHAATVLRMKRGNKAIVCDGNGTDYLCACAEADAGVVDIISACPSEGEPDIDVRLFQCLPKSDKMDYIVQKAVELGASAVIPVISARCVSRPDVEAQKSKTARWRKIAYEAAKQCGRGKVPQIGGFYGFNQAVREFNSGALGIIFYECGGKSLNEIIRGETPPHKTIDVFIGSEGGFTREEITLAEERGIIPATLGKRILRVDTAPVSALSVLMNLTGNL